MKKVIFFYLLCIISMTALISIVAVGCSKKSVPQNDDAIIATYNIPVYEQENVHFYEIQVSTDGKEWTPVYHIEANDRTEHIYVQALDLSFFFKRHSRVYTRIKAVDYDLKFQYSPIHRLQI